MSGHCTRTTKIPIRFNVATLKTGASLAKLVRIEEKKAARGSNVLVIINMLDPQTISHGLKRRSHPYLIWHWNGEMEPSVPNMVLDWRDGAILFRIWDWNGEMESSLPNLVLDWSDGVIPTESGIELEWWSYPYQICNKSDGMVTSQ
jgi:hypothetical protein